MLRKPMAAPFDREMLKKLKDFSILTRSGRTIRPLSDDSSIAGGNTERIYYEARQVPTDILYKNKSVKSKSFHHVIFYSHQDFSTQLNQKQLIGEMTYIIQPLVHLTSLGYFGTKSWIPWVLSGCCDIVR